MICRLNPQFIHQSFGHALHQRTIHMEKLGIYTGLPKPIPKISHPCCAYIIAKGIHLTGHPNLTIENLVPGTCFHLYFELFNKVSSPPHHCWCYQQPPILDISPDQSIHHSNSSRPSFSSHPTMTTRAPSSRLMKVENFSYQKTSCNSALTMKLLLKPL